MNYTIEEIKQAKKSAYNFLIHHLDNKFRKFRYDGRTRIGKLSAIYYEQLKNTINKDSIQNKRKERRKNKQGCEFINIFQRPIVKDWLQNKNATILVNRLQDGSRNHWAKDEKDFNILHILMKHRQLRKLAA
jgi:hypothetical protein